MYGCQQVLVTQRRDYSGRNEFAESRAKNKELINILTFLCEESHKLTNMGIYYARQLYFKAKKGIGKYDLEKIYKSNNHYKVLYSQAAQQILRTVAESFKSYYGLIKAYKAGKITDRPRIPNYRKKQGLALVSYPKQALKLKEGLIRVPLGKTCKRWFGVDSFNISMPSNLEFASIKELRILPRNKCFYFEWVYSKEIEKPVLNQDNALMIDPGLNNWLTCVSNVDTSFIVDGKHIKSMNRWYNKQVSTIKEGKSQGFWNKKLALITEKRNRQVKDGINKAARIVISHCLENNIGTVIFGWNQRNKDSINIGKKNNSEFVPIPTARLKDRIEQLCEQYGLRFVQTEESYSSKTSFLDGDYLPTLGEKPLDWKPSGRRVKRGLYRTANNWYINADCNASANIGRKVSRTLGLDLSRLSRGALTRPQRYHLWSVNKMWKDSAQGYAPKSRLATLASFACCASPEATLLESPSEASL